MSGGMLSAEPRKIAAPGARAYANERRHEYATLEHLLLALDRRPGRGGRAAGLRGRAGAADGVSWPIMSTTISPNLISTHGGDAKPTAGFQRVLQRAAIHVQSSGREEVTGANVLVAMFSERESHAVYFLQEQEMSRLDADELHQPWHRQGAAATTRPRPVHGADDDVAAEKVVQARATRR